MHRPIDTGEGSHNKVVILILIFSVDCCLGAGTLGEPQHRPPPAQQVRVYSVVINTEHIVNISCHLPSGPGGI